MPRLKRRTFLASLGAGAVSATAGCTGDSNGDGNGATPGNTGSSGSDEITLRVNEFGHENHIIATNVSLPFKKKVEERSNITLEMYLDSQLGDPTNNIGLLESGTADVASILTPYESDRIPISSLPTIPGSFTDVTNVSSQYYDLVKDHLAEEEFAQHGVVPLFTALSTPYQLATVNPKVTSKNDWNGLTVRSSSGYHAAAIEAMGGNPAQLSGSEQYQALERGTVDGTSVGIPNITSQNLNDHLKYVTKNLNMGAFPLVYGIRKKSLDKMSDSQRDVLMTAGEEITNESMEGLLEVESNTIDELTSQGIDVYDLPTDTLGGWQDTMYESAIDVWHNSVDHEKAEEYANMIGD